MRKDKTIKELIKNIQSEIKKFGYNLIAPTTKEQINSLKGDSIKRLNFKIPSDYEDFLKLSNGINFNGLTIFGTDFIKENIDYKIDWKNEEYEDLIVFGTGNESFLVYDSKKKKYQRRDELITNILNTYNSFSELIIGTIKEEHILDN